MEEWEIPSWDPSQDGEPSHVGLNAYYGDPSHPQCSPTVGHTCQRPSGRTCVDCDQPAGTRWGPMWCPDCDARRLDRVGAQLRALGSGA